MPVYNDPILRQQRLEELYLKKAALEPALEEIQDQLDAVHEEIITLEVERDHPALFNVLPDSP
jgi:hypothetical protein